MYVWYQDEHKSVTFLLMFNCRSRSMKQMKPVTWKSTQDECQKAAELQDHLRMISEAANVELCD